MACGGTSGSKMWSDTVVVVARRLVCQYVCMVGGVGERRGRLPFRTRMKCKMIHTDGDLMGLEHDIAAGRPDGSLRQRVQEIGPGKCAANVVSGA